jgi:hypothetical protein
MKTMFGDMACKAGRHNWKYGWTNGHREGKRVCRRCGLSQIKIREHEWRDA